MGGGAVPVMKQFSSPGREASRVFGADGRLRFSRPCLHTPGLPRHNDLGDAVFGEELAVPGPAGKQALDAAVGEGALNRKLLRQLHFDIVAGSDVIANSCRLFALRPGVEES